jgi:5'-methylthioadenosine phosphorylase
MADAGVDLGGRRIIKKGLYELKELSGARWEKVESPFGAPSDDLLIGEVAGTKLVFLPRHGRGHRIPPSEINYRANIDALKRVGVTDLISVSACGSLREGLHPGTFVLVDQYVDRTFARDKSFFTTGCVAHVSMAHPVCDRLAARVEEAARESGNSVVRGGTYLAMEGPQFSGRAESELYRFWGCDVIGMTNMPEAKLAREAEICYTSIAMVTDYDCWHDDHAEVESRAVSPSGPRPAPKAATGRSTPRSSPRPRRATRRSCGGSTPWRGGFSTQPPPAERRRPCPSSP